MESGARIVTDAPKDNHGEGTSFSPTDLIAGAYLSCLFTIIGIEMKRGRLPSYLRMIGKVKKVMKELPRKIEHMKVMIEIIGGKKLTEAQQMHLESLIWSAPVSLSIHPDIDIKIEIEYT